MGRSAQVSRQPLIFAFGFADRTGFRVPSRAAQAWGTLESAALQLRWCIVRPVAFFNIAAACCH